MAEATPTSLKRMRTGANSDSVVAAMTQPAWDNGDWNALPPLNHDVTADVCVVGLGGSGLAAIDEALGLGLSVVGLDAGQVAGQAAGRNGGFLLGGTARFHHDTAARYGRDWARAFHQLTLDELSRMLVDTPDAVRRTGSLRIASADDEWDDCQRQHDAMQADQLNVSYYSGPEGRGLLFPDDGVCNPLERCRALARRVMARGARLFEQSAVTALESGCAHTRLGTVRSPQIVVALDGRLGELCPSLAPQLSSIRLQMLATAPLPAIRFTRPVYARWGYDYWQQLPDGRLALGGCRDYSADTERTTDASPGGAVQQHLERLLRDTLRIDAPITHRWAAVVSYTASALPVFASPHPGVWAVGGYNGTGNLMGALYGRAAVRRAAGLPTVLDPLLPA